MTEYYFISIIKIRSYKSFLIILIEMLFQYKKTSDKSIDYKYR